MWLWSDPEHQVAPRRDSRQAQLVRLGIVDAVTSIRLFAALDGHFEEKISS